MAIKITQQIFNGIEFVRKSGEYNMLDRYTVARMCNERGYYDAAIWITENERLYTRLLFEGYEIVEPESINEEEE